LNVVFHCWKNTKVTKKEDIFGNIKQD